MKGHDTKMPRMEDILNLPVQDPPRVEFSSAQLNWAKVEGGRQGGDDIALIPYARVDDFVKGESTNTESPARFRIESRRKRPEGSVNKPRVDCYLEYTLYWCSYGPEDYRDSEPTIGDISNIKPSSGKGSRPGRRHMMRGCLCHFTIKRLYTRPLVALIIYNQRSHVDKTGSPCHGILDKDSMGTRAMYAPRISEELRQKIMSMLYVGIPLDTIIQQHAEEVQRHGGPQNRDDFLSRNDVRNMERLVRNSTHELHVNQECSVKIWVQRHRKYVFFFQENCGSEEPFVLGIQTDWQLQQMLRYGHNGLLASHSDFGLKKFKHPLCSLLVFDSSQNAIPVAWVVSSCVGQYAHKWMISLIERIHLKDPRWRPNSFLLDDPSFDPSIIREIFQCRVLLCLWHVRRSWAKKLIKKCFNIEVQREMFKHLGHILYCSRSTNTVDDVEEFMQIFVDQCAFIDYFRLQWLPVIEMWVNSIKMLPVASQEPCAAMESYHMRLKSKISEYANFWLRTDWLIHFLTTELYSSYWLDQYMLETDYIESLRNELGSCSTNSWYQAIHIPDVDVLLDEENLQLAKIISQSDRTVMYTIWNPGSEFSCCDCPWSMMGNLCKHVIKVANLCKNRQVARPLLAAQVYKQALLSLLQNIPDDPLVLEHAILNVNRLQQDLKGLQELSNSGILQPLPPETNSQLTDSLLLFSRIP